MCTLLYTLKKGNYCVAMCLNPFILKPINKLFCKVPKHLPVSLRGDCLVYKHR